MSIDELALAYCKLNLIQQYQFKEYVKEIQKTGGIKQKFNLGENK